MRNHQMMNMDIKSSILANEFVSKLRSDLIVDRDAFASLCEALRRLKLEWSGAERIDRQIVQELYVIAPIAINVAATIREVDASLADEVLEMATVLDGLVLEALDG